jgi:proline dehydrogenase
MGVMAGVVRTGLPLVPRRLLWSVARRYVAGEELADAVACIGRLRGEGFGTILDVLGENVTRIEQSEAAAQEYHRALEALRGHDPRCTVSVKPTHLGLLLDRALCERLVSGLAQAAAREGRDVCWEMEDSPTVTATLEVFGALRPRHPNLGCVLQSRLFRSEEDVRALLAGGPGLVVRLVKGIYLEPPEVAFTAAPDIARNYVRLARLLLDGGAFVGLATHDEPMARELLALLDQRGLTRGPPEERRYEFQCLMGVRREFAQSLRDAGHPVRVYVPYGRDWHAYSLRRLQHNPEIARHVLRALLRRGG